MNRVPPEKLMVTQLVKKLPTFYGAHKSPPLIPVLRQMYPLRTFPPRFPKIHSNIIFFKFV